MVAAGRGETQGNSGEAMMAALNERRWQTGAEARTTAADKRGQQQPIREGSSRGGEMKTLTVDERGVGEEATMAVDKRLQWRTRGTIVANERRGGVSQGKSNFVPWVNESSYPMPSHNFQGYNIPPFAQVPHPTTS